MMKVFFFAARLEAQVRREVEALAAQAEPELLPIFAAVSRFQAEFELLLDRAQYTDIDTCCYPEVKADSLLGPDSDWQTAVKKPGPGGVTAGLTALWLLYALVEKSGQYYQQAAANSAHPATKLFLSSLVELKAMLRRRLDGRMRVLYNAVWAEVGFAPFVLGKD